MTEVLVSVFTEDWPGGTVVMFWVVSTQVDGASTRVGAEPPCPASGALVPEPADGDGPYAVAEGNGLAAGVEDDACLESVGAVVA